MRLRRAWWRWCALVCALALVPAGALMEGAVLGEPLAGEEYFPAGASQEQAGYRFEYRYPQLQPTTPAAEAINEYYQKLCAEECAGARDMAAEALALYEEGAPVFSTNIQYQVVDNTEEYFSVIMTREEFAGFGESKTMAADVFALDGVYAGQKLKLAQVLGLEQEAGVETGLSVSGMVYQLIWQIMQQETASLQKDYFDGLTEEALQAALDPETDFYLDEDGNVGFFIQTGMVAGEVEGILVYPFGTAELLSAMKE